MRTRAFALSLAVSLLAASPAVAASANEHLQQYEATISRDQAGIVADSGIELDHAGFNGTALGEQDLQLAITPSQASSLEAKGIGLTAETLPKTRTLHTGGDSPNPYYDVFRSYSEHDGIADELRNEAAANRDVAKLVTIGTSLLGKPILAIKITADARNVADGSRPAVLFGAVNHAREWIAAEVARREAKWFLAHKSDPRIAEILKTTEIWVLPVFNPDGYDYTFTCGTGATVALCGPGAANSNRLWRKTLRDNNNNGIYGDAGDGVDPNRNFPEQVGARQRGLQPLPERGGLPRPVRELRAGERGLRPLHPQDQAGLQPQLPLRGPAAERLVRLHHQPPGRRRHALARDHRHRRRRGRRPVPARPGVGPVRDARRDGRLGLLPVRHDRLHARARHGRHGRRGRQLVRLPG